MINRWKLALVVSCVVGMASPVRATFHLWDINELYTNADGTVQFIELFTAFNTQQFTNGQVITFGPNTFTFPGNTPSPTGNHHLLIATSAFAAMAGVTPDFILADHFLSAAGGTVNFVGADFVTFPSLPTDGVRSRVFPANTIALNSPTNYNGMIGFVPPTGDFDGNGSFECADVDALVAEIVAGTNDAAFDLNVDGQVNGTDLADWRAIAGAAELPSGTPYLPGDANLSGAVDGSDFGIWNGSKFTPVAAWCSGDFNADGFVDGSDFGIWNSNKFLSSDGTSAVPEPNGVLILSLIGLLAIGRPK